jgi:hypothetical protein
VDHPAWLTLKYEGDLKAPAQAVFMVDSPTFAVARMF